MLRTNNLKILLSSHKGVLIFFLITCLIVVFRFWCFPKSSKYHVTDSIFEGTIVLLQKQENGVYFVLQGKEKIECYYSETNFADLKLGQKVILKGKLTEIANETIPNLSNQKLRKKQENIFYTLKVSEIVSITESSSFLCSIRLLLQNYLEQFDVCKRYLASFFLRDPSFFTLDEQFQLRNLGMLYLYQCNPFLIQLGKRKRFFLFRAILLFGGAIFYSSLSFGVAFFFHLFPKLKQPKGILFFFCCLLWFDPYWLFQMSFWYLFLIYFFVRLTSQKSSRFLVTWITIPLNIYFFSEINLFRIFLSPFFLLFGSIHAVFCLLLLVFPMLDGIIGSFYSFLESFALSFHSCSIVIAKPSLVVIVFIYLLLFLFYVQKRKIWIGMVLVLLGGCYSYPKLFPKTAFYMLDVGQADAMFFQSNRQTMILDSGGRFDLNGKEDVSFAYYKWIPFLHSLGIQKLDYIVITHGDVDHIGYASVLLKYFKVGKVYLNEGSLSDREMNFIQLAQNKNISCRSLKRDQIFSVGDFHFYSLNTKHQEENDSSIVLDGTIYSYHFLLLGDISSKVEKEILKRYEIPAVDFLKIAHHGSKTSTSELLLQQVSPRYALISVGKNNLYHHPHETILNLLKKYQIEVLQTQKVGTIKITFRKKRCTILTYSP